MTGEETGRKVNPSEVTTKMLSLGIENLEKESGSLPKKLEIRDSQNLTKLGLGAQLI